MAVRGASRSSSRAKDDSGASLVEYTLLLALILAATLASIDVLTAESGEYLSQTSSSVGAARPQYSDLEPRYPDPTFEP